MRAFIAIDIKNEELLTNFRKLQSIFSSLKPDIKLISPNNLHLTLSFLGEITLDESKKISSKLHRCLKETLTKTLIYTVLRVQKL